MKTITENDVTDLVAMMKHFIPGFEVKYKSEAWHQRLIGFLLRIINNQYMTSYVTAMFGKIWLPSNAIYWTASTRYSIYRHEFIHLLDAKKWSFLMSFSYLVLLPTVFTMRSFWELRGFVQNMITEYEQTGDITGATLDWIVSQFVTSKYFWMYPFRNKLRSKLETIKLEIKAGNISGLTYPHKL